MIRVSFFILIYLYLNTAFAEKYQGRISAGAFMSKEKYSPESGDSLTGYNNDFLVYTGRFFLSLQELGKNHLDATVDLRDKYNPYAILDKETKTLSPKHTFQARQLNIGNTTSKSDTQFQFGRFQVLQSAYNYVDGASFQKRIAKTLYGAFLGYNPVVMGQSYLEFNEKANTYSLYFSYNPKERLINDHFQTQTALVQNTYNGEIDRSYIYNNTLYQWGASGYGVAQIYLDFVPRIYVQNGLLLLHQNFSNRWNGQLAARAYDVVQYRRVSDIRERLEPSPYKEVSYNNSYKLERQVLWGIEGVTGKRSIDNLDYNKVQNTLTFPRFFSKESDGGIFHYWRESFTNRGNFYGLFLGHFRKSFEYDLTTSYGSEKQTDGTMLFPFTVEGSLAFHFSNKLYSSLTVQSASDKEVDILSLFFKLTYRFGNTLPAEIRDGAAPRGRL